MTEVQVLGRAAFVVIVVVWCCATATGRASLEEFFSVIWVATVFLLMLILG